MVRKTLSLMAMAYISCYHRAEVSCGGLSIGSLVKTNYAVANDNKIQHFDSHDITGFNIVELSQTTPCGDIYNMILAIPFLVT
jgi:hypothetical protein